MQKQQQSTLVRDGADWMLDIPSMEVMVKENKESFLKQRDELRVKGEALLDGAIAQNSGTRIALGKPLSLGGHTGQRLIERVELWTRLQPLGSGVFHMFGEARVVYLVALSNIEPTVVARDSEITHNGSASAAVAIEALDKWDSVCLSTSNLVAHRITEDGRLWVCTRSGTVYVVDSDVPRSGKPCLSDEETFAGL